MSRFVLLVERLLPFLKSYSIKKKIKNSYVIIISLLLIPSIISVASVVLQTLRYDKIITNVSKTNQLNQIVKTSITNEIWDIFSGKKKFGQGEQYLILNDINRRLEDILQTTQVQKNREMLAVAQRAVKTLKQYVDRMGLQIEQKYPVAENEQILDEIRSVSALVSDVLQDFIVLEIESTAAINENIKESTKIIVLFQLIILLLVTLYAIFAQRSVALNINSPIQNLEKMSQRIAEGDLNIRMPLPQVKELDLLTENLNVMAVRIQELIQSNIEEQRNRQKSEMNALQAQITPHFLYNTLDTIIWLAEAQQHDQVIDITRAFSNFFRISLSKGEDWITVGEELEHVRSYLTIQKIRYRDILDYQISYDPQMADYPIIKLLLQPIVENALYHGIKNKRSKGSLIVKGWMDDNNLYFQVEDNGKGMTQERLHQILKQMADGITTESRHDIYGLYNVSKRLELFYNKKAHIQIESENNKGTKVLFSVPLGRDNV